MVIVVGILLVLLVGGYISYPLFMKNDDSGLIVNEKQLQKIGEEIEQEVLTLRKYPENISRRSS